MFQVKNLTVTHKKDLTTLVEGLSFTLAPGDRAALIGEEGNGKSSVLKLLYNPALVEPYAEWTGEIVDRRAAEGLPGPGAHPGAAGTAGMGVLPGCPRL